MANFASRYAIPILMSLVIVVWFRNEMGSNLYSLSLSLVACYFAGLVWGIIWIALFDGERQ